MANRTVLKFNTTPSNFDLLAFSVFNAVTGYSKNISKTFVTGVPFLSNQVLIHPTTFNTTMANLLDRLQTYDTDGNITYSLHTEGFTDDLNLLHIDFNSPGDYGFTLFTFPIYVDVYLETIPDVPALTINPFPVQDLSIEIIDTYENELPLIIEFTEASSPKLSYDSGDDLLQSFMTSKLTFNILVTDGVDAHFKHLYTGDEKRYLVKLLAYDVDENEQLLWQGYLLPDQYREPYVGGVYFVDFTAIDMLANLKNRYLKPWYYQQRMRIIEIIGLCLKTTGIDQNILVSPALLPSNIAVGFKDMNIDLRQYITTSKNADLNTILSDILESNLLTIYNYKGYWTIVGFNNKRDKSTVYEQYDLYGVRLENIVYNKTVASFMDSDGSVDISIKSPYKNVSIDFSSKGTKNLFSETVVQIPVANMYSTLYFPTGAYSFSAPFPFPLPSSHYLNLDFNDWIINVVLTQPYYRRFKERYFSIKYFDMSSYNVDENTAINNYFECPERPYVLPDIDYKIIYEVEFSLTSALEISELVNRINNGSYDVLSCFQFFLDDVELLSNRPSFTSNVVLYYNRIIENNGGTVKFVLSLDYRFENAGFVKFRCLVPILNNSSDGFIFSQFKINKLEINVVEDYVVLQNVATTRPINYTLALDYKSKFISTADDSLENNIGLGTPITDNYFYEVARTDNPGTFQDLHIFPPATFLIMTLKMWDVDQDIYGDLFSKGYLNSLFLTKSGLETEFISIYGYKNISNVSRMGYLFDYEGYPKKPKKYTKNLDVEAEDVLKYMKVSYAEENMANRENWIIANEPSVVRNFNKTLAAVLHNIYSKSAYVKESDVLALVFPDTIMEFYYDEQTRNFIPTRLELDLFSGKTRVTATEDVYEVLTDITFE